MGDEGAVEYCFEQAGSLADHGHYGAALIYLVQAAEIATKELLWATKKVKPLYFISCVSHLREAGLIDEGEEMQLRQINRMRNLAIHSGHPISKEEYESARKNVLKLIEKLK